MASKNYYLVDTENVGSNWKYLLADKASRDEIFIFYTDKSPYISYADMCEILQYPDSFKTIKCYTGRDALDFQLDSYLGFLLRSAPKANYYIISNDNGYEAICRFWGDMGYSVFRKTAADIIAEKTNSSDLADTANEDSVEKNIGTLSESSNNNDSIAHSLENGDCTAISTITSVLPTTVQKKAKKGVSERSNNHKPKRLSKDTITTPSAITTFLPEKYRDELGLENKILVIIENSDINKLQPLYNTFVKQFGQSKGLDIYKSIKSHIKDIKKEISNQ